MLEALLNLDASLLLAIQDLRLDWLDPIVAFYTQLGNAGLLWIVLSLSMLCWRPTRRAGALALGTDRGCTAGGPDGAVPAVCGSPLSHGCAGWGFDRNTVRLGGAEAGRLQDGSVERK